MLKYILLIFIFVSQSAFAQTVFEKAYNPKWRIVFQNPEGPFNIGLCWWHSRLQRSIIYLAEMAPDQPKPSQDEARKIVRKLIEMDSKVTIPGFQWPIDFTYEYSKIIIEELSHWQIKDTFLSQAWTRGLMRVSQKSADDAKQLLDSLYEEFNEAKSKDEILWIKLKFKVGAHSALLLNMVPSEDHSEYVITVIDSNFPLDLTKYIYTKGSKSIALEKLSTFKVLPWVGYNKDLKSIKQALDR